MNRDEYMRIKGELVTATENGQQASIKKRKAQEALQGWVNGLHSRKVTEELAIAAHDLIDQMLAAQQQELECAAYLRQYKQMLECVFAPPPSLD